MKLARAAFRSIFFGTTGFTELQIDPKVHLAGGDSKINPSNRALVDCARMTLAS